MLILKAGTLELDTVENWWIIRAQHDWLWRDADAPSFEPFQGIQQFPERGLAALRNEVVIAALANAVVTAGPDGIRWITGGPECQALPAPIQIALENQLSGRMIAFLMTEKPENI